jgi:hypothetical protein
MSQNDFWFLVLEGFGGVPPIRPLETLHNALSLKMLDDFLEKVTSPPSPPKYPSTPLQTPPSYVNQQQAQSTSKSNIVYDDYEFWFIMALIFAGADFLIFI